MTRVGDRRSCSVSALRRCLGLLALAAVAGLSTACSGGVVTLPPATPVGLYVATEPRLGGSPSDRAVLVFPLGASGDTAPIRRIAGTRTGFSDTDVAFGGVAVNRDGQVFVALNFLGALGTVAQVLVFPRMADGDVEPVRQFGAFGFRVDGMALGQDGRVYLACDDDAVRVYAPGAAGPVASPERTISGPRTLLSGPTGIAVDSDGFIYVANRTSNRVVVFAPGASGDAAPAHQFSGPLTELSSPVGLALRFDLLWVTNSLGVAPRITGYGTRHPPNFPPVFKIEGPNTLLVTPFGIVLDRTRQVFVADGSRRGVLVYAPGALGDVAPARRIEGPNTRLGRPVFVALYEE